MRSISLTAAAFVLIVAPTAFAQAFIQYSSREDFFAASFPGEPNVRTTTWMTEHEINLPARVYSVDNARGRFSMTVVDFTDVEKLNTEDVLRCQQRGGEGDTCRNSWRSDVEGAIVWATGQFFKRDAKVTFYAWYTADLVPGHQLQLLNADQSRTFAFVAMHQNKLYVMEGTVPKGYPEPGLFQQSMGWVDKDGNGIRYQMIYSNSYHGLGVYPVPPLAGRGAPPRGGR